VWKRPQFQSDLTGLPTSTRALKNGRAHPVVSDCLVCYDLKSTLTACDKGGARSPGLSGCGNGSVSAKVRLLSPRGISVYMLVYLTCSRRFLIKVTDGAVSFSVGV
ncbi:hypothetical protein BaRGS_00037146, partial [Batillaria attramentaria]